MTENYKGFVPAPSNTPGWPTNPDTGNKYDFDTEIEEKLNAQIVGLTQRSTLRLEDIGGTGNDITASTIFWTKNPPGLSALADGNRFWYVPVAANDGDVTMKIDAMASPAPVLANDGTTQVPAGYFQIGRRYELVYDNSLAALIVVDVGSAVIA